MHNLSFTQSVFTLTSRVVGVPVQDPVPGDLDALLLEDLVDAPPVLDVELHLHVVDDVGLAQARVLDRLLQGEALAVERDQAVAERPLLDRALQGQQGKMVTKPRGWVITSVRAGDQSGSLLVLY